MGKTSGHHLTANYFEKKWTNPRKIEEAELFLNTVVRFRLETLLYISCRVLF